MTAAHTHPDSSGSDGTDRSGQDHGLPGRAVRELAAATAILTIDHDVIGTSTLLLAGCVRAVGAAAAGLVLSRPDDRQLELLASTSHRAEELELYRLQVDEGPCVDAVATGKPVTAAGLLQVAARWPTLREAFQTAGFQGVHAVPLIWHGNTLGAVNLFFAAPYAAEDSQAVAQAFADIAAVTIVHSGRPSVQDVIAQTRAALEERVVIERAKGVLAYTDHLPLDQAFDQLLALAARRGRPLGHVAAQVVADAIEAPTDG